MEIWRTHKEKMKLKGFTLVYSDRDACPLPGAGKHIFITFFEDKKRHTLCNFREVRVEVTFFRPLYYYFFFLYFSPKFISKLNKH